MQKRMNRTWTRGLLAAVLLTVTQLFAVKPPGDMLDWYLQTLPALVHVTGMQSKTDPKQEWYLRLTAEMPSRGMKDSGNVLGQLNDSADGKDGHDLQELVPFGDNYLTIVFPHDDWAGDVSDFTSDFHAAGAAGEDSWTFEVRTSDTAGEVTLYWMGLYLLENTPALDSDAREVVKSLSGRMWLEDVRTGTVIRAVKDGARQRYTFTMDGSNVRTFRWGMDAYGALPRATVTASGFQPDSAAATATPNGAKESRDGLQGVPGLPQ